MSKKEIEEEINFPRLMTIIISFIIALILALGIVSLFALVIMFSIQNIVSLYSGVIYDKFLFDWRAFLSVLFLLFFIDAWSTRNLFIIQTKIHKVQEAIFVVSEQIKRHFSEKKSDQTDL